MNNRYLLTPILLLISSICIAQEMTSVPFNSTNWEFGEADPVLENYMGEESIQVDGFNVTISDLEFLDGTIEVDINFPDARFFPGVFFRMQDGGNLESFYIRPHQSGNPDASQYTPIFNGLAGWQLYHGEGHGDAIELQPDIWHHIKINVRGDQADIYFNDMEVPHLMVTDLKRDLQAGAIGVGSGALVRYANFKYSTRKPILIERPEIEENSEVEGLITSWNVSDVVEDLEFQNKIEINTKGLTWTKRSTESSGTINLAKYTQREEGKNTVLTKLTINSAKKVTKELLFGYSDFVWVYLNGQLMYGGRNDFRSRDYRYLGTIGFFDSVYLPLKKGDNEVIFVISENFGGWGVKAKLTDLEGLRIK